MSKVRTIGLDLAKTVFQIHGAETSGAVVFRKQLSRRQVLEFRGTNKARVAITRKRLTIAFQIQRDPRPYERCGSSSEDSASASHW